MNILNLKIDLHCLLKDLGLTALYSAITFFDEHILAMVVGDVETEVANFCKMIGSVAMAILLVYKAIAQITKNKQESKKLEQERHKLEQERIKVEQELEMLRSAREIHDFMMEEEKEARRKKDESNN